MNHLRLLIITLSFSTFAFSQQDKIKLYNNEFKASEILGAGKLFGPLQVQPKYKTELFGTPVPVGGLNDLLGRQYTQSFFADTKNLLDMQLDMDLPILDSINFQFYRAYSFKYVLDKDSRFADGTELHDKYVKFKKAFKDKKLNNQQRREILFDDENAIFLESLEQSKYDTYSPPIGVTLSTTLIQEFKFGLTVSVVAELKKKVNGKIDAKTENAIKDSIYKYVEVNNCTYNEIKLNDNYVTFASSILEPISKNRDILKTYSDNFSKRLFKYFQDPCASIVVGAAVLSAEFDYTKFSKISTSIGATLNLNLSNSEKLKIASEVMAQYTRQKTKDLKVTTAQTNYYVKYAFSDELELGNTGCK